MKSPAFQFYPDKWLSHTRRLSDIAYRVFHELLCWMWANAPDQCSVEASVEAVAVAVARPAEIVGAAMADIQNQYAPLLSEQDGRWVCNGLRKEVEKQAAWRDKSRAGGEASAEARQRKYGSAQPTPNQQPNQSRTTIRDEPNQSRTTLRAPPNSLSLSLSLSSEGDTPPTPLKGGVDDAPGTETGKAGEQTHKGVGNDTPKGASDTTPGTPPKRTRRSVTYDADFLAFWECYPRKDGKEPAARAWAARTDRPPTEELVRVVRERIQSDEWQRDGGAYIPHAATWLNQGRWQDSGIELPIRRVRLLGDPL